MAQEVKIPAAGESITTASLAKWHKADGDHVEKGERLVTIETDKVSTELEADLAGTLKILVPEGEEVDIGTVIAEIEEGEGKAPAPAAESKSSGAAEPDRHEEPAAPRTINIKVPAAGESITSASVAQWHKRNGDQVTKGEKLVTLDTDKVSSDLEADASGLLAIIAAEGEEVDIGAVIGTI
ncbi:MAG: dihydrolipoyllysine succinyltransferase, partial [Akkermansiaceae bacterium]|nr:dihydrolipoyllysine succinyltransferase [Akkermansiaceae bacterium]